MSSVKQRVAAVAALAVIGAAGAGAAYAITPSAVGTDGFTKVTQTRVFDSGRIGNDAALASGQSQQIDPNAVTAGLVPAGATSVEIQITAAQETEASGDLDLSPALDNHPGTSNLNYTKGVSITSSTVATLGADGTFYIYNHGGTVGTLRLIVDVIGYYAPVAPAFQGAYYSVAKYDVGNTNGGAVATVACKATTDVAISGGVQTLAAGTNGLAGNVPVSSSFPGRMDWSTNTPIPGRLDGWIVQFGGNSSSTSLGDPHFVDIYALCIPGADIAVDTTYTQSSDS